MFSRTFFTDEIYHVYNRGVDKRTIFENDNDREKWLSNIIRLNDNHNHLYPSRRDRATKPSDTPLVDVLAFCLMPNHYHLLIRQKQEGGISKFMQRMGNAYTLTFNNRHGRSGRLFESTYKATWIFNEPQHQYITKYIHLNPLSLIGVDWKNLNRNLSTDEIDYLINYQWSSFSTYLGRSNRYSFLNLELLSSFTDNDDYLSYISAFNA